MTSSKTDSFQISEKTKEIFDKMDQKESVGGAGGSTSLNGLIRMDKQWELLRNGGWKNTPQEIVFDRSQLISNLKVEYDVIICGGTLGVFYAVALQQMGYRVCIVERNKILGRDQEWNISRKELETLLRLGLLTQEEINSIISIEFNPVRVGFHSDTSLIDNKDGYEVYINDILNLGILPSKLIEIMKQKFISLNGIIEENTVLETVKIHQNLAEINCSNNKTITSKLVIDAMGNASPISKQIRGTVEPDGICIVVGSCARGFEANNNTYSDVIYTDTPISTTRNKKSQMQYFWEAFPSGSGKTDRTTYLFTYMDAKPERPSIAEIIEDYWTLLPRYQGKNVDELQFLRVLYGLFPTYRDSPIQSKYNRLIQVGDASGIQSPLSFGGFGSLTRHLNRIITGLDESLKYNLFDSSDLSKINPYQPNLSACWMFQRAMSIAINNQVDSQKRKLIINTLSNSFSSMEKLGEPIMRPFLQDVLQFSPLLSTLLLAAKQDPLTPFKIAPQVGILVLCDFIYHFIALGWYTFLHLNIKKIIVLLLEVSNVSYETNPKLTFTMKRMFDAWKFGSGLDYDEHEERL
eukprot:gene10912-14650_t